MTGSLRMASLLVATLLALGWPGAALLKPAGGLDATSAFEASVASLAPDLPKGASVGIILLRDPLTAQGELAAWYLSQYALSPSIVRPILAPRCRREGLRACGALGVDFLLARRGAGEEALQPGDQLPLVLAGTAPGLRLLKRGPP